MTNIKYCEEDMILAMSGHAGDKTMPESSSVCAAVSALIQTLAIYITELPGEAKKTLDYGVAIVAYEPLHLKDKKIAKVAFDMTYKGMVAIAQSYPGYIKIIKS